MSNFGPEDAANREVLQRLVALVTRFLEPEMALTASGEGLEFTESRPLGGTWALDALWNRLGIGAAMRRRWRAARTAPRSGLRVLQQAAKETSHRGRARMPATALGLWGASL